MERINQNAMIGAIITAAIVVVCLATILMPILTEVQDDTADYSNDWTTLAGVPGTTDLAIVYDQSDLTVNSTSITNYIGSPIFMSDTLTIDCVSGKCTVFAAVSGSGTILNNVESFSAAVDVSEKTVTLSNITYSSGTGSTSLSPDAYSWAYVADNSGEYAAIRASSTEQTFYFANTSDIHGAIYASGTYYTTVGTSVYANGVLTTDESVTITKESIEGINGVYSTTVTTSASTSDIILTYNSGGSTASINLLVMPLEVIGEKENVDEWFGILSAVPVLFIVLLVLGFTRRTND